MLERSNVKTCLERWREPLLHASSVLFWEKDFYPAVIAGVLTTKFIFIWWWDPTFLTAVAVAGFVLTLVDYLGPKITAQIFKPENWTGDKEKRFDQLCGDVVGLTRSLEAAFTFCHESKERKPVLHFLATLGALFFVAWVGGKVNNFFLLYLVTLIAAMLPGMHKRGLLKKYFSQVTLKISEAVKGKDGQKKLE